MSGAALEHRLKGIACRLGAASCFATMSAAIKLSAGYGVSTYEVLFYRNAFSLPVILTWLIAGPGLRSVRTQRGRAHAGRSLLGLFSMGLTFEALALLPLAEATAISFTAPLFATILSALLLRESVGRWRWSAVAAGLIGVLIVVNPGGHAIPVEGLLVGFAAALSVSGVTITIRQIGLTEPATTTVFWFNIATVALTAPGMVVAAASHPPQAWALLALVGLTGGVAQVLMTSSLRLAPVATVAPFDYLQLLWAALYGWLLWSERPPMQTIGGAVLIAASGILIAWREHRLLRQSRSRAECA